MKITKWFSVKQPPCRPGFYEIKYASHRPLGQRMFFDGIQWFYEPNGGLCIFGNDANFEDKWRGIEEQEK